MKLLSTLYVGIRAGLLAALVATSINQAAAADEYNDLGTPRTRLSLPNRGEINGLTADNYVRVLNPHRIALFDRIEQTPGLPDPYLNFPFWDRLPLFNMKQNADTIIQGLRDYGEVGVVDRTHHMVRKYTYSHGRIFKDEFPDEMQVIQYYHRLEPDFHKLARVHQGLAYEPPAKQSTEWLPYYRHRPILESGQDGLLPQALQAYHSYPNEFWYRSYDGIYLLFSRDDPKLFRNAIDVEHLDLNRILYWRYFDTKKYDAKLSSLINGKVFFVSPTFRQSRAQPVSLRDYPRFNAQTASRQDLIDTLQTRGRFRYYQPLSQGGKAWKVKVTNSNVERSELMDLSIEPLSAIERVREFLHTNVRLPV